MCYAFKGRRMWYIFTPEEITIPYSLRGSSSSHACATQSCPLHRWLISLEMMSVRRKLTHPPISKSTTVLLLWPLSCPSGWILPALPTVNKSQLLISSPKSIYSGKIKNCNLLHADMHRESKKKQEALFTEGKRKLRGGAVITIELCYKHRVLPIKLLQWT